MHDWLTGFRGGERVLEAFCELFPEAPLYTLIHRQGKSSELIDKREVITSLLSGLPGVEKHYRKLLPLFPWAVDRMRISEETRLILSSSHCVIKGLQKPSGAKHLCYIHSPMRYIYDQFDVYFGEDSPFYQRLGAKLCRGYLQEWDKKSNSNVDLFIANSHFVAKRIREFYQRDCLVIHPFVDLADFSPYLNGPAEKEDYFLVVSAFAPNKRVDLAIKAFNKLGYRLKIVGSGQQEAELKSIANDNIEFLGSCSRGEVVKLFAGARGFIFPGVEDFGITPLESLAAGTPLIALKKGGVLETQDEKTAVFFEEETVMSLCEAVNVFMKKSFDHNNLISRAKEFSKERFQKKISDVVEEYQ